MSPRSMRETGRHIHPLYTRVHSNDEDNAMDDLDDLKGRVAALHTVLTYLLSELPDDLQVRIRDRLARERLTNPTPYADMPAVQDSFVEAMAVLEFQLLPK
jgi:hypothetical protein